MENFWHDYCMNLTFSEFLCLPGVDILDLFESRFRHEKQNLSTF